MKEAITTIVLYFAAVLCVDASAQQPSYFAPVVVKSPILQQPSAQPIHTQQGVWMPYQRPLWVGNALFGPVWIYHPYCQPTGAR